MTAEVDAAIENAAKAQAGGGTTAQTFFDISSKASGQPWSMTSYCPVPGPVPAARSNRGYEGGFGDALMLKDLKLALGAAGRYRGERADGHRPGRST